MGTFAGVFKELRMKNGLTQQEIADKLKVSRSSIGMYEKGEREPNYELLETIADFFNVDMNYLLRGTEIMANNQFSEMLKHYLMVNGKKQTDLVNDLGYDKSTVSNWCAGLRVPKVDVIIDIANYLHVDVGNLIVDNTTNEDNYYINDIVQFLYENPEYKVLFDTFRKVKKEDIQFVKEMIERMK